MSDEQDKLKVSLEPPKLFGRKKKSKKKDETASASEHSEATAPTPESPAEAAPVEDEAPTTPSAEDAGEDAASEAAPADEPAAEETAARTTDDEAAPPEAIAPRAESPVESDVPLAAEEDEPIIDEIDTGLEHDDELAPTPAPAAAARPSLRDRLRDRISTSGSDASDDSGDKGGADSGARPAPMLDNYPAAVLSGAIVGLGMVVLTWLSLRGCEAVRGTASCGGGPGFLLLVAMFIVSVMLGSAILKSFEVPDPGSSSFLAVGLVAVVSLLLLIDVLDHWSMLLVIPILSVGAYALSVYITKTFVEPGD